MVNCVCIHLRREYGRIGITNQSILCIFKLRWLVNAGKHKHNGERHNHARRFGAAWTCPSVSPRLVHQPSTHRLSTPYPPFTNNMAALVIDNTDLEFVPTDQEDDLIPLPSRTKPYVYRARNQEWSTTDALLLVQGCVDYCNAHHMKELNLRDPLISWQDLVDSVKWASHPKTAQACFKKLNNIQQQWVCTTLSVTLSNLLVVPSKEQFN